METKKQNMNTCAVCNDKASGVYFGVLVCLPCKSFYIRSTKNGNPDFSCVAGDQNCNINLSCRLCCQFCRFQKCLEVGMHRKEKPEVIQASGKEVLCKVCGDIGNGVHFGVVSCEGCKKFFRKGMEESRMFECKGDKKCPVNPRSRNNCRFCRYQRCVDVGMSREAIRMGRPKKDDTEPRPSKCKEVKNEEEYDQHEDRITTKTDTTGPNIIREMGGVSNSFSVNNVTELESKDQNTSQSESSCLPKHILPCKEQQPENSVSKNNINESYSECWDFHGDCLRDLVMYLHNKSGHSNYSDNKKTYKGKPPERQSKLERMLDVSGAEGYENVEKLNTVNEYFANGHLHTHRNTLEGDKQYQGTARALEYNKTVLSEKLNVKMNMFSKSYWLKAIECSCDDLKDKEYTNNLNNILKAYTELLTETNESSLTINQRQNWPAKGEESPMWYRIKMRMVKNSMAFIQFTQACYPDISKINRDDLQLIYKHGSFQSMVLLSAVERFDPLKQNFKSFWNWKIPYGHPPYYFRQALIQIAIEIHSMQLDRVEAAIMCLLSIVSADWALLQDTEKIEALRMSTIKAFHAYNTEICIDSNLFLVKYGLHNNRITDLMKLMPLLRKITLWHAELLLDMKVNVNAVELDEMVLTSREKTRES